MKKLFLIFIVIFISLAITACGNTTSQFFTTEGTFETTITTVEDSHTSEQETTTLSVLAVPEGITVVDNIISFNPVTNADKYRVYIYDSSDILLGEYNVTSGFNLSLLLGLGTYKLKLKATGNGYLDSALSDYIEFSITNPDQVKRLEGELMNDFENIRWFGRTRYDVENQSKYFYFTASGFEVAFYGTELIATLLASNYDDSDHQAYVVVLLDGEENPTNGKLIKLDKSMGDYVLAENLEEGYHTLKLLKRSEAIDSNTALKSLSTDGYFTNPPKEKSFKLQFIAASSSTGYGNLGDSSTPKTSANSDGLMAFAYLTSFMLDSEISIFSASGWGVSRGWNTGGQLNGTQNIPNAYLYTAIDDSNQVLVDDGRYDTSQYQPDVLVVNLGTNDFTASGYNTMSDLEQEAFVEIFKADYLQFLLVLNNMYPQAKIIVAYGLMNEAYYLEDITLDIIDLANQEINEHIVYAFLMEGAGTNGNPTGSNSHPNVGTSINVAEDLANLISTMTGREVVREIVE